MLFNLGGTSFLSGEGRPMEGGGGGYWFCWRGGGFEKNHRMGGEGGAPHHATMGNPDVIASVSTDFLSNLKGDVIFHCTTYDYSSADLDSLHDHFKDFQWEDIFKVGASPAAIELGENPWN